MKRTVKRIGIMGGSFNPIHNGHLAITRKAKKEFDLDQIIFVPTGKPPHKALEELAPKNARYQMVLKAISRYPSYRVSRVELDRRGYTFAIDTLQRLTAEIGEKHQLYYIVGMDSINEILEWKKPLELFNYCDFIVATRPKTRIRTLKRMLKFPPLSSRKQQIFVIEVKMDLSSSQIRERIKAGKSVKRFLPKAVLEYIERRGLYKK
jgi:nicotinate-nucleotide adenylyltransferase